MQCPKCSSKNYVKNWSANWKPRKKCKDCWCNYTQSEAKWKPQIMKKVAVILYLEWLWFRSIWRVLWVSNVKKLWNRVKNIDCDYYASDGLDAYMKLIPWAKHLCSKKYTQAIESFNNTVRHYLDRFKRKTHCYSKSIEMVKASLYIFFFKDLALSIFS